MPVSPKNGEEKIELKNWRQHQAREQSTQLLHFVTAVDGKREMVSFCCEGQPLATVRSYGPPARCPFCQEENPVGGEWNADDVLNAGDQLPQVRSNRIEENR
jgi:hypothetical protein